MITPDQLIERANSWLVKDKGVGPLRSDEIVALVGAMAVVTDMAVTPIDLEKRLANCVARAVCKLRGYSAPKI